MVCIKGIKIFFCTDSYFHEILILIKAFHPYSLVILSRTTKAKNSVIFNRNKGKSISGTRNALWNNKKLLNRKFCNRRSVANNINPIVNCDLTFL